MKKTFKITTPNPGTLGAQYIFETGGASGVYQEDSTNTVLSRATKIVQSQVYGELYGPGSKFGSGDFIKYEDGS
jgi:hypothetical protein